MDSQPTNHQSKHDRSRTKWTASLDKIFVDLVLEQVLQGNRSNNTFNKNAWEYIREEFNKQAGVEFNRKQLKKHLDVLRNRFLNVKSHFDQNGFGGDEPRHMTLPMIGDEVWEDYIEFQAYPVGEPTKIKDCPIYEQLCQIFSESESGIGRYAQSSHYIELDKETLEIATPLSHAFPKTATMDPVTPLTATVGPVTPSTLLQDDSSSRSGEDVNIDAQKKRKSSTASSGRGLGRGRPRKNAYHVFDESIADAMLEMATASKLRADALIHSCDQFSITKCVELLDQMSGLDEGFYLNVLDLFEDPVLREIFVSLKNDKRLTWLQGRCIFAGSTM